jgi:hypothetical protein
MIVRASALKERRLIEEGVVLGLVSEEERVIRQVLHDVVDLPGQEVAYAHVPGPALPL